MGGSKTPQDTTTNGIPWASLGQPTEVLGSQAEHGWDERRCAVAILGSPGGKGETSWTREDGPSLLHEDHALRLGGAPQHEVCTVGKSLGRWALPSPPA